MGILGTGYAQVMQSSSYKIQTDSINFSGGLSTSSNYTLESTAGEIATGESSSSNYALKAGYQQMHEVYLSLSSVTDVALSPSIPGVSGGVANGSTTVTVITDGTAGYELLIESESSPAMQKALDSISDYVPASNPDFSFITGTADSHFGYSPEGVDIVSRFKDNGSACAVGALDTVSACWDGLSTTSERIALGTGSNHPNGATTTIRFRVGIGSAVVQTPGIYTATTTLTALAL
jgi:hypothetical protein